MKDRFVIAGSGHCGTAWLALAFNLLGVPVTHEGIHTLNGQRPWPERLRGDVSLAAVPYLGTFDGRSAFVIRDPLAVVNSFARGWTFASRCPCHRDGAHLGSPLASYVRQLGVRFTEDDVANTTAYLLKTVEIAERSGAWIVKIEDVTAGGLAVLAEQLADVPFDVTEDLLKIEGLLPSNLNAHGYLGEPRPEITWEQIRDEQFAAFADRYGYR